jgi:hypothetical protein
MRHWCLDRRPLDAERPFIEAMARFSGIAVPKKIPFRGWLTDEETAKPQPADRIFAAVEEFKVAFAEVERAYMAKSKTEEGFLERYGTLEPDCLSKLAREKSAEIIPEMKNTRTRTHQQISRLKGHLPADVIAMFHRELNRQTADYEATIEEAERAADDAWDAMAEKRDALLGTPPTTAKGFAALIAFIDDDNKYCLQDHFRTSSDETVLNDFLQTLTRSAFVLAGLPQASSAAA